jgi:hypothetical protein
MFPQRFLINLCSLLDSSQTKLEQATKVFNLRNLFNSVSIFKSSPTATDSIVRGLAYQPAQAFDGYVTRDVSCDNNLTKYDYRV